MHAHLAAAAGQDLHGRRQSPEVGEAQRLEGQEHERALLVEVEQHALEDLPVRDPVDHGGEEREREAGDRVARALVAVVQGVVGEGGAVDPDLHRSV
ncbi:MAG: hypothetical protein JRF70_07790 [Deltaproteobacteria bacterium]|nr:hypothetical protein [Deltaproteobacteria bacterium]